MIIVFGSINLDLVTPVAQLPVPGVTVLGANYTASPGGKGANQALAARRAGAQVALVGAVGADDFAAQALALLKAEGVDLSGVAQAAAPTGAAFIAVDARGENLIVVASGANAFARAHQLETLAIGKADILILQREVPDAQTEAAALHAKAQGARVILNLAPAGVPSHALLGAVDVLIVNEHEAAAVSAALKISARAPDEIAAAVHSKCKISVIVTLGAAGAVAFDHGRRITLPAPPVEVVDTTGAGDAFVGAFAAALDRGLAFEAALARGLAAGSLACAKRGAQPATPFAEEIERLAAGG